MDSGVTASDQCIEEFTKLQQRKSQEKFLVYGLAKTVKTTGTKTGYDLEIIHDTTTQEKIKEALKNEKDDPVAGGDATEVFNETAGRAYNAFVHHLAKERCKWAVYDFEYMVDGGKRNKIVFISCIGETDGDRTKVTPFDFSSSRQGLRRRLQGIQVEIEGQDADDIDYKTLKLKLAK
ncbi:hypothetical protein K438DRAFT_830625 [Mycena galopus ATCC 62051]|nr:hypothetical protein K438DRAFT_830625 [Mycena galopus ATCC 62051]